MPYIPHTDEEIRQMLEVIGVSDIEGLFTSIPSKMRCNPKLNIPKGIGEQEVFQCLSKLAAKNETISSRASFLGAGTYRHYIPAAVAELSSRSEFQTPYTPYQPEISQGTLQALFEYQSQICRLFGMDVSNASHYSGATALADAVLMARRIGKNRRKIIAFSNIHPETLSVIKSYLCDGNDLTVIPCPMGIIDRAALRKELSENVAAVLAQFPNFFGIVEELGDVAQMAHNAGALFITSTPEPLALGILKPPGEFGADIAVGEGLSFGLPTSFGGPTLGIFTVRKEFVRQMPGRVCGKTTDSKGQTGYCLTLATREQHIRREKATSNICSNQALCATTAGIYLALLGKEGIRELAHLNAARAGIAKKKLALIPGVSIPFKAPTFNEFVIECTKPAATVLRKLMEKGIFGGVDLGQYFLDMKNRILVCVTEMNTPDEIGLLVENMK